LHNIETIETVTVTLST